MSLPPGVTDSMIPGNTPEDVEWGAMLDAIQDAADDLVTQARNMLANARHCACDDSALDALLTESLAMARWTSTGDESGNGGRVIHQLLRSEQCDEATQSAD